MTNWADDREKLLEDEETRKAYEKFDFGFEISKRIDLILIWTYRNRFFIYKMIFIFALVFILPPLNFFQAFGLGGALVIFGMIEVANYKSKETDDDSED